MTRRSYSTTQVQTDVGLTNREIHYWRAANYVQPSVARASGAGSKNRWSLEDVWCLRVLRRLRDAGVEIAVAARVVPMVREAEDHRWVYIGENGVGTCQVGELERAATEMGALVVVDLEPIRRAAVSYVAAEGGQRSAEMREAFGKEAAVT